MVAVEDAAGALQAEVVGGKLVPRQRDDSLQVVELHAVVGTLLVEGGEFAHLLVEDLLHLRRPLLRLSLLGELVAVAVAGTVAEFGLDVLYLLVEEVVALLGVEFLVGFHADILHHVEELVLAAHNLQQLEEAVLDAVDLDEVHLVLDAQGQRRTGVVGPHYRVVDILECHLGLVGHIVVVVDILRRGRVETFDGREPLYVVIFGEFLRGRRDDTGEVVAAFLGRLQAAAAEGLDDCRAGVVVAGHIDNPDETCHHTGAEDVLLARVLGIFVGLAEDGEDHKRVVFCLFDDVEALLAADEQWGEHSREEYHVARG